MAIAVDWDVKHQNKYIFERTTVLYISYPSIVPFVLGNRFIMLHVPVNNFSHVGMIPVFHQYLARCQLRTIGKAHLFKVRLFDISIYRLCS